MLMRSLRTKTRAIMLVVVVVFVLSIFAMYMSRGAAPSKQGPEGDFAIASVDGQKIMASQVLRAVQEYAERNNQADLSPESIVSMRKSVLDQFVVQYELEQAAREADIEVPESDIDEAVARIESQFPTKEAFMQYMENSQISMKDLRKEIGKQLAQQELLQQHVGDVSVTPEETRQFYDQTKDLFFRQPEGINVLFARFVDEASAADARTFMEEGNTWDDAMETWAENISDFTPSGDAAFVAQSEFTEGRLKPVADLKMDTLSDPLVLSDSDVVLVIKKEKLKARTLTYDEVSGDVEAMIVEQKAKENQNAWLAQLREQANVEILDQDFFEVPEQAASADVDAGTDADASQEQ